MNQGRIFIDKYFQSGCGLGITNDPGVYAVIAYNYFGLQHWNRNYSKHILYIGSSKNIEKRVSNGKHPYRKIYDRLSARNIAVVVQWYQTDDYILLEKELIQLVKTPFNRHRYATS